MTTLPRPTRHFMRLCLALLLVAVVSLKSAHAEVKVGSQLANIPGLTNRQNKPASLTLKPDAVTVLTFGASWCAPCKNELAAYEKLAQEAAKTGSKVRFISLNIDNSRDAGLAFVTKVGLSRMEVFFDGEKKAAELFDPPTMPTTYIYVGSTLKVIHQGFRAGDEKKISAQVAALVRGLAK